MFQGVFPTVNIELYRVFIQPEDDLPEIELNENFDQLDDFLEDFLEDFLDDFSYDNDELFLNPNNSEIGWNYNNFEMLSSPSDLISIDQPRPLIRYGGMENLSEIPDEIDRISPLWMPLPILNENDENFHIFSRNTEEFNQDEYLLILEEIRSVEEEIRRLEEMAEFYHEIRHVEVYETNRFHSEIQNFNTNDTLDEN